MVSHTDDVIPERVDTRQHIANVTEILLKKTPVEKLNVKKIVDASHVSRTTFYRYFQDKYDVINWIYISEVDRLIAQNHKLYDLWLKIFEFMYSRRNYIISAFSYDQQNSLMRYMAERTYDDCVWLVRKFLQTEELSHETEATIDFFVGGCTRTWQTWVSKGMKDSPQFVLDVIVTNIPDSIRECFMTESRGE